MLTNLDISAFAVAILLRSFYNKIPKTAELLFVGNHLLSLSPQKNCIFSCHFKQVPLRYKIGVRNSKTSVEVLII